MTLIYDFDGTLTPYGAPRYPVLAKCGSIDEFYQILSTVKEDINLAYIPTYKKYLEDHGYEYSLDNICYGAKSIEFNNGVLFFLKYFKEQGVKQFIITASFEEFVKETLVAPYIDKIYGTLKLDNEDIVMMPKRKIKTIQEIIRKYNINSQEIIYFGDGITDRYAFEYVKKIGGKAILVYDEAKEHDKTTYKKLTELKLIDEAYPKDFSSNSSLFLMINGLKKVR